MNEQRTDSRLGLVLGAIVLVLLLLAGAYYLMSGPPTTTRPTGIASPTAAPAPAPATKPADEPASPPIKVGVILSHFTATGPSYFAEPMGYRFMYKLFREGMTDPHFDLYPVVEPGTAQLGELPAQLTKYFPGKTPIDITDLPKMRELEVIVAPFVINATPELLNSLETLVRDDGKGLYIRQVIGHQSPGFTPQVIALNGMKDCEFAWSPKDQPCKLVGTHPILGGLSGGQIQIEPNGAFGIVNGQALATVETSLIEPQQKSGRDDSNFQFAPFYVAELGKGKIVASAYLGISNNAQTISQLKMINSNAVKWLAGRLK